MANQKNVKETPGPHLAHRPSPKERSRGSRLDEIKYDLQVLRAEQDFYYEKEPAEAKVDIDVDRNRHRVSWQSDWHLGHPAVEYQEIEKAVDNALSKDGMSLNHLDDATDGSKGGTGSGAHAGTVDFPALVDPGKQFGIFKKIAQELHEKGRLGIVMDASNEHTGWSKSAAGVDQYDVAFLKGKVLQNGGEVTYHYPDSSEETALCFHHAGGGGSDQNPLSANKKRLAERDTKATLVASGHNHGRYGWEQNVDDDGKVIFTGIAAGTMKGTKPDSHPDPFMQNIVAPARGAGVITTHTLINRNRSIIPTLRQEDSDLIWDGLELLDRADKYGVRDEVLAEMKKKLGDTQPKWDFHRYGPGNSRLKNDHFGKGTEGKTKHWVKLVYGSDAILPIQIRLANNVGAGSSTSDMDLLDDIVLDEARKNPHVVIGFLRQLLASDTPKDPDRVQIVEDLIEHLGDVPGLFKDEDAKKLSTLFVLYDAVLRSEKWKATIGPTKAERENDDEDDDERYVEEDTRLLHKNGPYYAASEIEEALGVPMLDNRGEVFLRTRIGEYSFAVHDKLGNSASLDKPLNGLRTMERRHIEKGKKPHDFVIGGHMPVAAVADIGGVKILGHQGYVAPGSFSEFLDMGKGNAEIPSAPGQSITFFPSGERKRLFLSPNADQSDEMLALTTVEEGARMLGGVDKWKEKLGRKGKRTHFIPR